MIDGTVSVDATEHRPIVAACRRTSACRGFTHAIHSASTEGQHTANASEGLTTPVALTGLHWLRLVRAEVQRVLLRCAVLCSPLRCNLLLLAPCVGLLAGLNTLHRHFRSHSPI